MRLDSSIVGGIENTVRRILDALQMKLTFDENVRQVYTTVVTPASANTEFTVTHNLGKTPTRYYYNVDAAVVVYDSRRALWTQSLMYLKCSGSSTTMTVTIM